MASQGPFVWDLWGSLLAADPATEKRRFQHLFKKQQQRQDSNMKTDAPATGLDEDEFLIDEEDNLEVDDDSGTNKFRSSGVLQSPIKNRECSHSFRHTSALLSSDRAI